MSLKTANTFNEEVPKSKDFEVIGHECQLGFLFRSKYIRKAYKISKYLRTSFQLKLSVSVFWFDSFLFSARHSSTGTSVLQYFTGAC